MKHKLVSKIVAGVLSGTMLMTTPGLMTSVAAAGKDPYVGEVFIAYGDTEDEAKQWLRDNGWEPVNGDFNAGKTSNANKDVAAVMGIKRTSDPNNAVTDMAVMQMSGGYAFDDYEKLVKEKNRRLTSSFVPSIPFCRNIGRTTRARAVMEEKNVRRWRMIF